MGEEAKQKLSSSLKGMFSGEKHPMFGKKHSLESRKKMSESLRGHVPWNKGIRGVQVGWSKGLTKETDPRVAKFAATRNKRLRQGEIEFGGRANPSQLSWALAEFLNEAGFDKIVVEERFGPYSIDVLLVDEWIAFEADGSYWHEVNQTDYAARDAWLLEHHGLPVIRFSDKEIKKLTTDHRGEEGP